MRWRLLALLLAACSQLGVIIVEASGPAPPTGFCTGSELFCYDAEQDSASCSANFVPPWSSETDPDNYITESTTDAISDTCSMQYGQAGSVSSNKNYLESLNSSTASSWELKYKLRYRNASWSVPASSQTQAFITNNTDVDLPLGDGFQVRYFGSGSVGVRYSYRIAVAAGNCTGPGVCSTRTITSPEDQQETFGTENITVSVRVRVENVNTGSSNGSWSVWEEWDCGNVGTCVSNSCDGGARAGRACGQEVLLDNDTGRGWNDPRYYAGNLRLGILDVRSPNFNGLVGFDDVSLVENP